MLAVLLAVVRRYKSGRPVVSDPGRLTRVNPFGSMIFKQELVCLLSLSCGGKLGFESKLPPFSRRMNRSSLLLLVDPLGRHRQGSAPFEFDCCLLFHPVQVGVLFVCRRRIRASYR